MRRHRLTVPARLIVIHDELDLPPGQVRIKVGSGLAGNNGLRSVTQHLKTQDYLRVRIGIGKPPGKQHGANHVLARVSTAGNAVFDAAVVEAADAVEMILAEGPARRCATFRAARSVSATAGFDAVVWRAERRVRWGSADKLAAIIDGHSVLRWTVSGLLRSGASRVVVRKPAPAERQVDRRVVWCSGRPAGSGPIAGIRAALAHVETTMCWLSAGDQPLFAGAMADLSAAIADRPNVDAVVLVTDLDASTWPALWRTPALARSATTVAGDAAVSALYATATVAEVPDGGPVGGRLR